MKALARIVAEADGRGGTRLTELYGEAPLLPRRTYSGAVHLIGGAAGPLGGDELCLEVHIGPDAELTVCTVAAAVALPGPAGQLSTTTIHASVAAGGRLTWSPEPLVAAAGCYHHASSTVDLADGAALWWREDLVAGRHGEEPGRLRQTTRIRRAGRTLLHQELTIGPDTHWAGPAILGGTRATATLVVVDADVDVEPAVTVTGLARAARMPVAPGAFVTTAVAPDVPALRRALASLDPHDHELTVTKSA